MKFFCTKHFLHADLDKHPSYTSNQLCFYDGWNFWTTKRLTSSPQAPMFAFQKAAKLWRHATINITTATPDDGQERRRQFIPLVTQETTGNLQSVFKILPPHHNFGGDRLVFIMFKFRPSHAQRRDYRVTVMFTT